MKTQKDLMYEIQMKKHFLREKYGMSQMPRLKEVSPEKENAILQAIIEFEHDCEINADYGSKLIFHLI